MHAAQKSIISLLSTWGIFHSNFPLTSILFILFIQWVSLKESYQIMHGKYARRQIQINYFILVSIPTATLSTSLDERTP